MPLNTENLLYLENLCKRFRMDLIRLLHKIQTGHPGGSLSAVEIVTTLYFGQMKNLDPSNPNHPARDRFILSKGHAAPILYLNLAEKGFSPKSDLCTLRQLNSYLQGHPCSYKTPGVDLSTGPLGLGLSAGIGMALSAKLDQMDYTTYVLLGDGELQEGIVWEAAMSAAKFKVDNLIAFVDFNGVQLDGTTDEVMPMGDLRAKWSSFGWNVLEIDGHQIRQIDAAIDQAKMVKGLPTVILAKTVKGKGVSFMEGKNSWHGNPIDDEHLKQAMLDLGGEVNG